MKADGFQEIICRVENCLTRRFTTSSTLRGCNRRRGGQSKYSGNFETTRFTTGGVFRKHATRSTCVAARILRLTECSTASSVALSPSESRIGDSLARRVRRTWPSRSPDVSRSILKRLVCAGFGVSLITESHIGASVSGLIYRILRVVFLSQPRRLMLRGFLARGQPLGRIRNFSPVARRL